MVFMQLREPSLDPRVKPCMNNRLLIPCVALLSLASWIAPSTRAADPAATQPDAQLAKTLDSACGLALFEVATVEQRDQRASDGALVEIITFKTIQAGGDVSDSAWRMQVDPVTIVVEVGGLQPPGTPPFKPTGPILPGTMKKGQRYWIAIYDEGSKNSLTPGVLAIWPDDKTAPQQQLQAALDTGKFAKKSK